MAMQLSKGFDGSIMVDQYADPWPKQNHLQSLLMQNPALAAQQAAAKQQAEQLSAQQQQQQNGVGHEQFLIANSLTGSVGLGKRFTSATPSSQPQDIINRANGLTTSGIYQSPLMSHVATSNPIAAQTAAIQAAQNAAIQQQIQLQALQQTQPNPYHQLNAAQNSGLQALQDAQLQVQAQAAQIQALQAQSTQMHNNSVAQAQLHAQVQAQLMMNQQQHSTHQSNKHTKRYHPYGHGVPPPPPPPSGNVALESAPLPPKPVSVAPQVQAAPTTLATPSLNSIPPPQPST